MAEDRPNRPRLVDLLPERPLSREDVERLRSSTDTINVCEASVAMDEEPLVISIFLELGELLYAVGFSPAGKRWIAYGQWEGVDKGDEQVYELVEEWDRQYVEESGALE